MESHTHSASMGFKLIDGEVPTISDSDSDVPDLDSEEEQVVAVEVKKTKKKNKKNGKVQEELEDKEHIDFNPDFQFDQEDGVNTEFQGWEFTGDEKKTKKDVDLDGIIRRKGGLGPLAGAPETDSEDEAESGDSEDDDLAMDGFGMGAKEAAETGEVDEDDEKDDDASEDQAEVEDDMALELEASESEAEKDDEDSPEDVKNFYAPQAETDAAKSQIHQSFQSLELSRPVLKGLSSLGYTKPSPIQGATIPIALLGKDIIAGAVTGSGKTAAYLTPVIERLLFKPSKVAATRVIVLTPTRELAIQVNDVGKKIGKFVNGLTFGLAVGGLNLRQQEQELKQRPDIVIATPGRFIDHMRNSASFTVDTVEILIIDEADRMLEEGFQKELTEILELLPRKRQTMLFSATMNSKIKSMVQLSMKQPVRIMIDPPKQAASGLVQEFVRIRKREHLKSSVLFNILKKFTKDQRIVIFVARKEQAHKLRIVMGLLGLKVSELHGSLTQEQRLQSITQFKNLTVPVLICTDLASRGLDIPKIEVVINYDMPKNFEVYLHRVGRTARAGREGKSISFVGESSSDRAIVKDAIKSAETSTMKSKTVGREVNWKEVEDINKLVDSKTEVVEEILEEEKVEKEMIAAEMEIKKGENMLRYKQEIQARPRRTWFETNEEKKNKQKEHAEKRKGLSSKKRKQADEREDVSRSYKKTKGDRSEDQDRFFKKQKKSSGGKGKGKKH